MSFRPGDKVRFINPDFAHNLGKTGVVADPPINVLGSTLECLRLVWDDDDSFTSEGEWFTTSFELINDESERPMNKSEVFTTLENLGVGVARVEYSGGHDEGGVDNILLLSAEDPNQKVIVNIWDKNGRDPRITDQLVNALGGPVYDRYRTFAGEFSVHGEVIWDVESRTITFDGMESEETYHPVCDSVEW